MSKSSNVHDAAKPIGSRPVSMELNDASEWSSMSDEDKRIAALGYKPVRLITTWHSRFMKY